ncbi:MAG: adenosylcobinamide-GDP ribazoletransferase [Hyphomicrobiales bacterium]|nr:adenosylcobinamide-GDP ribazoletransferase [Hyphomicrobiales bacterium]
MRKTLHGEWRAVLMAVQFLTRIPIPSGSTGAEWEADLKRSPRYFPLVGGFVGLSTGIAFALLSLLLPPLVAAALALAVEALVTGAFHEDALADYCDAMGGGVSPEKTLEILKDSRIGSYGATGLALGLLVRASALAALPGLGAIAAAAGAGSLARLCAVFAMSAAAPLSRQSLVKDVGAQPRRGDLAVAALAAAPWMMALFIYYPAGALAAISVGAGMTAFFVWQMKRKVGGIFGDGLGVIAFTVQCAVLVICTAGLG